MGDFCLKREKVRTTTTTKKVKEKRKKQLSILMEYGDVS